MPISVRLPPRVEQKLAEYCVSHKLSKSEAVKRALEVMLEKGARDPSPYDIGRDIFERYGKVKPTEDLARHSKRLLRERLAGKGR
jgi:Arc/MetJ-type ribon-helix-helix transcriptional regulator